MANAGICCRLRQATTENLRSHVLELPSLKHGTQLHFPQEIAG